MNWKAWAPLIVAVALGLVAAKVAMNMVHNSKAPEMPAGHYEKVIVAKHAMSPGDQITPDDITIGSIAGEMAPEGTFAAGAEPVGRVVIQPMVKGQPVLEPLLAPVGAAGGLQALVPEGSRAVTLEINEVTGVAGLLTPGSRVDVLSTIRDASTNESVACTIVENVKVQAVGQRLSGNSVAPKDGEPQQLAKTVTLIATPKEAESIELASSTGRIRLILRNGSDSTPGDTTGVTVAELRHSGGANPNDPFIKTVGTGQPTTIPARLISNDVFIQHRNVQIIRGGQESTVNIDMKTNPNAIMTGTDPRPLQ